MSVLITSSGFGAENKQRKVLAKQNFVIQNENLLIANAQKDKRILKDVKCIYCYPLFCVFYCIYYWQIIGKQLLK
jgi:hypothetical protein